MPRVKALVTPSVLSWARETAGYSIDDVAGRLGVEAKSIGLWESGADKPSIAQAKRLAALYRRPLALFYLPVPPESVAPPPDYRSHTLVGTGLSPTARLEIRTARYRRGIALELLDADRETAQPFRLRAHRLERPVDVAARLRKALGVSLDRQTGWRDERHALHAWIAATEDLDVLVFQSAGGRWGLSEDEMWGASLYYERLPVILLTGRLSAHARIFSLFHELCHLALHTSGVCDDSEREAIEVFCNAVAGNALVPESALLSMTQSSWQEEDYTDDWISSRGREFGVSREVIVRRLLSLNRVTKLFYERKRDQYRQEYVAKRQQDKERSEPIKIQQRHMILRSNGPRFTSMVIDAYNSGHISLAAVSRYLDMKPKHLQDVQSRALELMVAR